MSSLAPEPSPAPSLATPSAPGFYPDSVYSQQEPPLDAAGRDLLVPSTTSSAAGPAILGAVGGLLAGGIGGAVVGAGVLGLASMHHSASLAANNADASVSPETTVGIKEAPAPEEAIEANQVGGPAAAAAAGVVLLDQQPSVTAVPDAFDAHGLPSSVVETEIAKEEEGEKTPTEENAGGLSTRGKALLGAGAAGVGGVAAAEYFDGRAKDLPGTTLPASSALPDEVSSAPAADNASTSQAGPPGLAPAVPMQAQQEPPLSPAGEAATSDSQGPLKVAIPPPESRFREELDTPVDADDVTADESDFRPTLSSRFSDSTYASSVTESGSFRATGPDSYEEQRAVLPRSKLSEEPTRGHKLEAAKLAAAGGAIVAVPAYVGGGFTTLKGQSPSVAQLEFGALSSSAPVAPTPTRVASELAAGRSSTLPHSPKTGNLSGFAGRGLQYPEGLQMEESSPSPTLSSTRAVKGSPNASNVHVGDINDAGPSPVSHSPHMKIAARRDSIGRNRLHKDSLDRKASLNKGPGSPNTPSSTNQEDPSGPGDEMWKASVAQVVNNETEARGHRPALVTIDSEDRTDFSSPGASHPPPVAPIPESPSSGHKLRKERRASSSEGKAGFLSKVLGRRRAGSVSTVGSDADRSPRGSMDA